MAFAPLVEISPTSAIAIVYPHCIFRAIAIAKARQNPSEYPFANPPRAFDAARERWYNNGSSAATGQSGNKR
jgi:hypothetical protein